MSSLSIQLSRPVSSSALPQASPSSKTLSHASTNSESFPPPINKTFISKALERIKSIFHAVVHYLMHFFCKDPHTSFHELKRGTKEDFFDYALRIKSLELNAKDSEACKRFIKDYKTPATPYLKSLKGIFTEQLKIKMEEAAEKVPKAFLEHKVNRLVKIFLKDKFNVRKPIIPEFDLAARAKWDPHHHASSIFADHFPKSRLFLPNYEQAYRYIRPRHRTLIDRPSHIKKSMEHRSFAMLTEVCSSYDEWHFDHKGKRLIPILAHHREIGAVSRKDVKGYDMCGMEKEDHYHPQRALLESMSSSQVVRLHMGETIIPESGRAHISLLLDEAAKYYKSIKPLRIGHGTHTSIEDMIRISKKGYYIEACLSSNKRTAIIDKRSQYPLGVMLLLGVKVVIGTDGGRLYSTTLPEEFSYAVRNLRKFHAKLQSSNEQVLLPNGDTLCFKHLIPLIRKELQDKAKKRANEAITYQQLGSYLDPKVLARISPETLVSNARELLADCYPEFAPKETI